MSDENGRFIFLLNNGSDVVTDRKPGLIIQSGKRLIQQKKFRVHSQRPDQRRPLAHAAGEFRGPGICKRFQAVFFEHLFYPGKTFRVFFSLEFDTEGHIFIDGTPFKELILLEHIAELFVLLRHGFSFEKHLTGLRWDQPCDDGEDGRFSTPAGPDDGEKFSGKNLKGQIGEGAGLAAFGVVGMGYIF